MIDAFDERRLIRNALKALLAYAPAKCHVLVVASGLDHGPAFAEVCLECKRTIGDGQHEPDCRWMRARSVIGAIRSFQKRRGS